MPFDINRTDPNLRKAVGSVGPDPSAPVVPLQPQGFAYPGMSRMDHRDGGPFLFVPESTVITGLVSGGTLDVSLDGTARYWYEIMGMAYQTFASTGANAGEPLNTYPISFRTRSPNTRLEPVPNWTAIANVASQGRGRTTEHWWPVPWVMTFNNTLILEFRNDGVTTVDIHVHFAVAQHAVGETS